MTRRQGFADFATRLSTIITGGVAVCTAVLTLSLHPLWVGVVLAFGFVLWWFRPVVLRSFGRFAPREGFSNDKSGFRGLVPYRAGETLPGRMQDITNCRALVSGKDLFVLTGEPGCGKSSLLNADLIPFLRSTATVVELRLHDDPKGRLTQLRSTLRAARRTALPPEQDGASTTAAGNESQQLVLVIDQFEELFLHADETVRADFFRTLLRLVRSGRLRLVIAIRLDYMDLLVRQLLAASPSYSVTPSRYYELRAFHVDLAADVASQILADFVEDSVVRREEIAELGRVIARDLLRSPRDSRVPRDRWTVLPAELQSIGRMLQSGGSAGLSVTGYRQRGGCRGLTREFLVELQSVVKHTTGLAGTVALQVLQALSPSGVRQAMTIRELARVPVFAALGQENLSRVMRVLEENRLVHRFRYSDDSSEENQYEVIHDFLAELLRDAPDPFLIAQRSGQARLHLWLSQSHMSRGASEGRRWRVPRPAMPLSEVFRLRRYAHTPESRRLLRDSMRAHLARLGVVSAALGIGGGVTAVALVSNPVQLRITRYALDVVMSGWPAEVSPTAKGYVIMLVKEGRIDDAILAFNAGGLERGRGELFAAVADTLLYEGFADQSVALLAEALRSNYIAYTGRPVHDDRRVVYRVSEHLARSSPDSVLRLGMLGRFPSQRAFVFVEGAKALSAAGASSASRRALLHAREVYIGHTGARSGDSSTIAGQLAELSFLAHQFGDDQLSKQLAREVESYWNREDFLTGNDAALIVRMYATLGRTADAALTLRKHSSWGYADEKIVDMAIREISSRGYYQYLVDMAKDPDSGDAIAVYIHILAEAGEVDKAFELLESVGDKYVQQVASVSLAKQRAEHGDSAGVWRALNMVSLSPESIGDAFNLQPAVTALFQTGQHQRAVSLSRHLDRLLKGSRSRNGWTNIALLYARGGQPDSAIAYALGAEEHCEELALLANHWLEGGQRNLAFRALEPISKHCISDKMSAQVAEVILLGGSSAPGWRQIEASRPEVINEVAGHLALKLADTGQTDHALNVLRLVRSPAEREAIQTSIAVALVRSGRSQLADALLDTVSTNRFPNRYLREWVLAERGAREASFGRYWIANLIALRCRYAPNAGLVFLAILEHAHRDAAAPPAAARAAVSSSVGARWFREAGGTPPSHPLLSSKPPPWRYLSLAERDEIAFPRAPDHGVREIASWFGRTASKNSRKLRRNAATPSGGFAHGARPTRWHADRAARRPELAKLGTHAKLRRFVHEGLEGVSG